MAKNLSARKRQRQNVKARARNRARRSQIKTIVRKFEDAVGKKDAAAAEKTLVAATKLVDQTAAKGTVHKNAAARTKSRLQRKLNALKSR